MGHKEEADNEEEADKEKENSNEEKHRFLVIEKQASENLDLTGYLNQGLANPPYIEHPAFTTLKSISKTGTPPPPHPAAPPFPIPG